MFSLWIGSEIFTEFNFMGRFFTYTFLHTYLSSANKEGKKGSDNCTNRADQVEELSQQSKNWSEAQFEMRYDTFSWCKSANAITPEDILGLG